MAWVKPMRDAPLHVALAGVAGHGASHARRFLELQAAGAVRVVAFAEPAPERRPEVAQALREAGATHHRDPREIPADAGVEAVVIATPIHLHHPMTLEALRRGWHVLLEKPAAPTPQELSEMIQAQRRAARIVAVNFQHVARPGFRQLLALLRRGTIGPVRRVIGRGLWLRDERYYARSWAGRLRVDGRWVLDGTLMNPFAHLVNQALIAASPDLDRPAEPHSVAAELYHANPIESEDTACARVLTRDGVEILVYTTLAFAGQRVPALEVQGAEGVAWWDYNDRVTWEDRRGRRYEVPIPAPGPDVADNFVAAVRGAPVALYSPLSHSSSQVRVAAGAFLSSWPPAPIPEKWRKQVRTAQGTLAWTVPDIEAWIDRAADRGLLFSEVGVPWARPGATVGPERLEHFDPPDGTEGLDGAARHRDG